MAEITIIGMEKTFSQNPLRQGKIDRLVLYRTGDDPNIRFVDVPDETFDMAKAQQAIRDFEAQRRLTTPVKFTI
jgi:hypothetical protein